MIFTVGIEKPAFHNRKTLGDLGLDYVADDLEKIGKLGWGLFRERYKYFESDTAHEVGRYPIDLTRFEMHLETRKEKLIVKLLDVRQDVMALHHH